VSWPNWEAVGGHALEGSSCPWNSAPAPPSKPKYTDGEKTEGDANMTAGPDWQVVHTHMEYDPPIAAVVLTYTLLKFIAIPRVVLTELRVAPTLVLAKPAVYPFTMLVRLVCKGKKNASTGAALFTEGVDVGVDTEEEDIEPELLLPTGLTSDSVHGVYAIPVCP
jgi:hypothetical protein